MSQAKSDASEQTVSHSVFLKHFSYVFLPLFLAAIDQTVLVVATPAIALEFGYLQDTFWVAVAYLLSAAVVIPIYGRLGDVWGKRDVLLWALGIFALGSLVCAISLSLPQLIFARVLQGIGGGGLVVLSQALISELLEPQDRVRFQGYFALMFTSASVCGPLLGGVALMYLSWQWLFWINIPMALMAGLRLLKLAPGIRYPVKFHFRDFYSAAYFLVAMSAMLFWLSSVGRRYPWFSQSSAFLLLLTFFAVGGFVLYEKKTRRSLLPLDLLKQPTICYVAMVVLMFGAVMYATVFYLPTYLQLGHRISPFMSALLLLPLVCGIVISSSMTGRWIAQHGHPDIFSVVGMFVAAAALLLLGLLPYQILSIVVLGFLTGVGFGMIMPSTQMIVLTLAGREKIAAATSVITLARALGSAIGTALFGTLAYALIPKDDMEKILYSHDLVEPLDVVVRAFHYAFLVAALVALIGAVCALKIPKRVD